MSDARFAVRVFPALQGNAHDDSTHKINDVVK